MAPAAKYPRVEVSVGRGGDAAAPDVEKKETGEEEEEGWRARRRSAEHA